MFRNIFQKIIPTQNSDHSTALNTIYIVVILYYSIHIFG